MCAIKLKYVYLTLIVLNKPSIAQTFRSNFLMRTFGLLREEDFNIVRVVFKLFKIIDVLYNEILSD